MTTPESLQGTINNVTDLHSVVKTMKALAAVSIRQYEKAVESLAKYQRTVEMGLQIVLKERYFAGESIPLSIAQTNYISPILGVIIFGSDQGLCGQFNEQIVNHTIKHIQEKEQEPEQIIIATVGSRPIPSLTTSGYAVSDNFSLPSSAEGITEKVQNILLTIDEWRTQKQIRRILLFYNQPVGSASYKSQISQLLPLDVQKLRNLEQRKWSTSVLPTFTMDWQDLFSSLVQEYLFVSLYLAFAASLASENASRLASMQSAQKNIEERLTDLNTEYRHLRQSTITAELLEVVAGFEALS